MWPFKKKKIQIKEEKPKKYQKIIKYKDSIKCEVGKTVVLITFEDGFKFETIVYGYMKQEIWKYLTYKPRLVNSITNARDWCLTNLGSTGKVGDDPNNPNKFYYGKLLKLELGETSNHEIEFEEAYVVEEEVNE